jgi:peptidoglycan hydrolase CwlO-like protein
MLCLVNVLTVERVLRIVIVNNNKTIMENFMAKKKAVKTTKKPVKKGC